VVVHAEHEVLLAQLGADGDHGVFGAVVDGVGHQVRQQLRHPLAVAAHVQGLLDAQVDLALRVHPLHLIHHVGQGLGQVRPLLELHGDAVAQAAAGEVQHVFHQLRGALAGGEDVLDDAAAFFILGLAQ